MTTTLGVPPASPPIDRSPLPEDDVRVQVWGILGGLYRQNSAPEQRGEARYPYPYLVHLTPVEEDGVTPCGEPVVVVGKHLSERGFGFYHPKPLPYRRMIVSLETAGGTKLGFLIELSWCRFTRHGWYESGGRFRQTVPPPDTP